MKLLNVQTLIEDQSQKYKERLLSQYSRLLDSAPSFPIYYSIDGVNSSAELGTQDMMEYVGPNSPIKFKKILNMPIYSLNAITASITYDEATGGYTDYEDQGLVLNSVLKPLPGDHFIIPEFNPEVIFVVTNVNMRAIRGQDHYVIDYSVVSSSRILNIEAQVVETYETIFRNIGTENTVLLRKDDYNLLNEYIDSYGRILERYADENYNEDYGYLATPEYLTPSIGLGTCKYLIKFLMTNRIIYFDEILNTVFAFEQVLPFEARHNKIYSQSFILNNFVSKKVPVEAVYVNYKALPISLFKQVNDELMGQSIEFNHISSELVGTYVPESTEVKVYGIEFPTKIINKDYLNMTPIEKVIARFINNETPTIIEFNDVIEDYSSSDIFRFYFIPFILFILKIYIKALQIASK